MSPRPPPAMKLSSSYSGQPYTCCTTSLNISVVVAKLSSNISVTCSWASQDSGGCFSDMTWWLIKHKFLGKKIATNLFMNHDMHTKVVQAHQRQKIPINLIINATSPTLGDTMRGYLRTLTYQIPILLRCLQDTDTPPILVGQVSNI